MKQTSDSINLENKLKLEAEKIHNDWDNALENNNVEALLKLYALDAIIESPLIPYLLEMEKGICQGQSELRVLFEKITQRKPAVRKYFKQNFFTDGKTLIFEYPGTTPHGEQMDFMEVMEIKNGLIQHHRVYWGWRGFQVMKENAYHR